MKLDNSKSLYERASKVLVGGVNSPVRAFNAVGGSPIFVRAGKGAYVYDADGNEYVDYVLSYGPLVLGHAHPHVLDAVSAALGNGSSFGMPTEAEIRLAERIIRHVPSIEKLRLVNSGTEAVMSAIRLARGYTGRDIVVKAEGCYHGHVDGLLVKAGSGLTTLGTPTSPGIPAPYASCTLTVPFNDLDAVREVFAKEGDRIACMIVEPVPGNMGVVLPQAGYLEGLREITRQHSALLVFDEVMSGFRVAMGGAQERYGVTPDLTILGKVIGGGLPVGAYGGSAAIMDNLSPVGPVYQAGTLSGNPLATAAGLATLDVLETGGMFAQIEQYLITLCKELEVLTEEAGCPVSINQAGTMACMFFTEGPVTTYSEATASNTDSYKRFFWEMLRGGVSLAPAQFEAMFMSAAHGDDEIDRTLDAAKPAFKVL